MSPVIACFDVKACAYVCRYSIQQNNRVGFVLLPLWFLHFWMTLGVTLYLSHTGSTCQDDNEHTVTMPRKGSGKLKVSCVLQSACALSKKTFFKVNLEYLYRNSCEKMCFQLKRIFFLFSRETEQVEQFRTNRHRILCDLLPST